MTEPRRTVGSTSDLLTALATPGVETVSVTGILEGVPTLALQPGQALVGEGKDATIRFAPGEEAVRVSTDNTVQALALLVEPVRRALFNDTSRATLGRLVLRDLHLVGCVTILAEDAVHGGHVDAIGVDIEAADARGGDVRPKGFGVEVVLGAWTLWNRQPDPRATITAELLDVSAGRAGAPVRGSGIFVAGTPGGGRLLVSCLRTGAVWSDGGIAPGTAGVISGGVFTISGARVGLVRNTGPVTTYGANDMVLDNWGEVDRWIADGPVTSFGSSAIGFVNFGPINVLHVNGPVETFGGGARGFNVYDGTVEEAVFDRVVTHGDGSVGIQISRPVGSISVKRGIETLGGSGPSLVKGVVVQLPAIALSIKPGGSARRISISGGVRTRGSGIDAIQLHGDVTALSVEGGFGPAGGGFERL